MMDNRDLPAPFTPADADVSTAPYMPLVVSKLRRSRCWLAAKRKPELGYYMLNLWVAAFCERPAGSLEDDDTILAEAAMCDPKKWLKVKAEVLSGFVKCSDGRLYHRTVCDQVDVILSNREGWRKRQDRKRKSRRVENQQVVPPVTGDSRQSHALSDNDSDNDSDSHAGAAAVVENFYSLRRQHWPSHPGFPADRGTLLEQAKEYLAAGATVDLCRSVLTAGMERKAASQETPPQSLRYFKNSIADAISRSTAPPILTPKARTPRPGTVSVADFDARTSALVARLGDGGAA